MPSWRAYTNFYTICAESYADLRRFRWILKYRISKELPEPLANTGICTVTQSSVELPVLAGHEGRHVLRDTAKQPQ